MRWLPFYMSWVVAILSLPRPAYAEPATLSVDGLSFYYFVGLETGGPVGSAWITFDLEQTSPTTWSLSVDPSSVSLPSILSPQGVLVDWSLSGPASGLAQLRTVADTPRLAYAVRLRDDERIVPRSPEWSS